MKKILMPRILIVIIGFLFSTTTYSQSNLAAYFRFCGCSLTDASGGGYVLTPSAKPPKCINTILDQGMDFANNNDNIYLYTYNIPEITKAITLAAWISPEKLIYSHLTNDPRKDPSKPAGFSYNPIFTKGISTNILDIYTLSVDYDSLYLVFSDGPNIHMFSGIIKPIMKDYQYYHVAATYDMAVGKVYLYFNGKQIGVHNYNKPLIANPAEPLVIGESFPLGKESFSGVIDEVRIYNKALNSFQIDSLYKVTNQKFLNLKDTSTCKNDSVILIAPTGYSTYLWKFKNVSISSSIDTAKEAGQYKLYARDQQCLYIDSLNVTIFPNPVVKGIPSVDTLCTGSSLILSGSGASTYIWSDNVKNGISFIPTKTIYSLTGTDSNRCIADTTVSITFLNPTVSVGNDQTICLGETVNLSATNTGLVSINHFAWNNGQNTDNIVVSPIHDSVFIVTATNNDPACIAYDTVAIKVNKLPVIKASPNDTICAGETSTLSVTQCKSYVWNNNEISQTINVKPETTTLYKVIVSDNNNCKNEDSVLVYVYPKPTAYFTFSPDKPDIKNALVSFTNMSKDNIKFSTWNFGDSYNSMFNTSNEFNPTHEYSQAATYNVSLQVQDINGCKDSIVKTIQVQSEFTFYAPNAFTPNQDGLNDFFNVHGDGFDFNTFQLSIYTRWGELIFTSTDINNGWDGMKKGKHQLCPAGIYVWHVTFSTTKGEKKVFTGAVTLIN